LVATIDRSVRRPTLFAVNDPRHFAEPDRFLPERWTEDSERRLPRSAYFPFGGGQRVCIGAPFAMMEASLVLDTIARRFRFSLPRGEASYRNRPCRCGPGAACGEPSASALATDESDRSRLRAARMPGRGAG
jgi:cytochrome P450